MGARHDEIAAFLRQHDNERAASEVEYLSKTLRKWESNVAPLVQKYNAVLGGGSGEFYADVLGRELESLIADAIRHRATSRLSVAARDGLRMSTLRSLLCESDIATRQKLMGAVLEALDKVDLTQYLLNAMPESTFDEIVDTSLSAAALARTML